MKMLKDILKWQSEHTERMRKLMGVSHNTHLWMRFIKGVFIGILFMCLNIYNDGGSVEVEKDFFFFCKWI